MKLLIINGPNLNMLGIREPAIYGTATYQDLEKLVRLTCQNHHINHHMIQSNHEGVLIDAIGDAYGNYDAIIINPAAYTHTSIAILDALKAVGLPTVEVHLTDTKTREAFRHQSYVSQYAESTIMGKGINGYTTAILYLKEKLSKKSKAGE